MKEFFMVMGACLIIMVISVADVTWNWKSLEVAECLLLLYLLIYKKNRK